jgi:hypothetical protein
VAKSVATAWDSSCAFGLGLLDNPRENLLPLILGGVIVFPVAIVMLIGAGIAHVLTKDFVVPQMACEGVAAMEGWRRLWPMLPPISAPPPVTL